MEDSVTEVSQERKRLAIGIRRLNGRLETLKRLRQKHHAAAMRAALCKVFCIKPVRPILSLVAPNDMDWIARRCRYPQHEPLHQVFEACTNKRAAISVSKARKDSLRV
jgi:hypothetical protein